MSFAGVSQLDFVLDALHGQQGVGLVLDGQSRVGLQGLVNSVVDGNGVGQNGLLFGLGGTTYGMWEETMAFYPLLIPVFLAAGYDAVVGISGSSPAYVFMFIEAMADEAVAEGMPRALAYEFAAQAVLGSAKMVLETGKHPGELKDMVCSPAGTTIQAVKVLEETGFRASVMDAVEACIEKSRSM